MKRALLLEKTEEGSVLKYQDIELPNLSDGEVRIRVSYTGINYKDRLAVDASSKVVRKYPMTPGIDFSGIVEESKAGDFSVGDQVFVTGYGYGTDQPGGYQETAIVKQEHLMRLPEEMSMKDVMIYGTAGFTAALSVDAIEKALGSLKGKKILVTGGSGGVSSHGVLILRKLGAEVAVTTRTMEKREYLESLGAQEVLLFDGLLEKRRALSTEKWDGVLDTTGGEALGNILTEVKYGGVVCTSGNLSGIRFESTVFPFILRGITLKGIDSVMVDHAKRNEIFKKLATSWYSADLERTVNKVVSFKELHDELLHPSEGSGRVLVDMSM
ncbi:acryloyl-CoA reductase [Proteiniclasticum ruminis]|nr:acryloyl-CoA reductase [Proteiniclasticum ruminis]